MRSHEDLDRFFRIINKGIKYLFCSLFAKDSIHAFLDAKIMLEL